MFTRDAGIICSANSYQAWNSTHTALFTQYYSNRFSTVKISEYFLEIVVSKQESERWWCKSYQYRCKWSDVQLYGIWKEIISESAQIQVFPILSRIVSYAYHLKTTDVSTHSRHEMRHIRSFLIMLPRNGEKV